MELKNNLKVFNLQDKKTVSKTKNRWTIPLLSLITAVSIGGYIGYRHIYDYVNAPISYYSDGIRPLYTLMIPDSQNNKEGYTRAKFGSSVNHSGGFKSIEEMNTYPRDFESKLEASLNKRIVEIPDEKTIKRGLRNATKYTRSDGTRVTSFNGSGMHYYLEIYAFDRNEIKNFEVHEIDSYTKEKIRQIEKIEGDVTSGNFKWGKFMGHICIEFEEAGVGNAQLLKLDITDKKDNKYHSFIELVRKSNIDFSKNNL